MAKLLFLWCLSAWCTSTPPRQEAELYMQLVKHCNLPESDIERNVHTLLLKCPCLLLSGQGRAEGCSGRCFWAWRWVFPRWWGSSTPLRNLERDGRWRSWWRESVASVGGSHHNNNITILFVGDQMFWIISLELHSNHVFLCLYRSICVGLYISVDYWWTSNVTLRCMDEVSLTEYILGAFLCPGVADACQIL